MTNGSVRGDMSVLASEHEALTTLACPADLSLPTRCRRVFSEDLECQVTFGT